MNGGVHSLFVRRKQYRKDIDTYDTHRKNINHLRRDGGISRWNHEHDDGLHKLDWVKRKLLRQHGRKA